MCDSKGCCEIRLRLVFTNESIVEQPMTLLTSNRSAKAQRRISSHGKRGFSLIELLIVVAIILIIAAIAIPNLLKSRIAANNAAAAAVLRSLNTAEASYATFYPTSGFATLTTLGPGGTACSVSGGTSTNACLIDATLGCSAAECQKDAYWFNITLSGAGYTASATPLNTTQGDKDYCSNEDSLIHVQGDPSPTVGGSVIAHTACEAMTPQ